MKIAAIIWVCALISGVGCVGYVNHAIDTLATENLQGSSYELQPAKNTVQLTSTQPLQATADPELQPALGYKALNWQVSNLRVQ